MKLFNKNKENSTKSQQPSIAISSLQRLIPIAQLNQQQLEKLPIRIKNFKAGQVIFNRGEIIESLDYLMAGELYLDGEGEKAFQIEADTFYALHPLASGQHYNVTAIVKKDAQILQLPVQALSVCRKIYQSNQTKKLKIPESLKNNSVLRGFLSSNDLKVPALSNVVFKLRRAIEEDADLPTIVKIINLDPSLSAKLIQVSNSPLYRGVAPISSCLAAINRIGLNATKNIITSISLSTLYSIKHRGIDKMASNYWQQSVKIGALSYVLARELKVCNPDEAMLAGLTCQIGVIPFLRYVDSVADNEIDLSEVAAALPFVITAISQIVLKRWSFPDEIKNLPVQIKDWFLIEQSERIKLADIVLLARYHSLLDGSLKTKLPPITALPSFSHLENGALTADKSLKILVDAQQQVRQAMQIFPQTR